MQKSAKQMVAQPKFRTQVVRDKTKYRRKRKHSSAGRALA